MSIFGIIITYACCWWMVLFMVLPWKVKIPKNPPAGPAASAPINPLLKKKIFVTTLLAIIPTLVLYFYIGSARANDDIYHASSNDCPPAVAHQPAADVVATDTDATLRDGNNIMSSVGDVYVGINVPANDYSSDGNPSLRRSDIYAGAVKVKPDGTVEYNGQAISQQPVNAKDCK